MRKLAERDPRRRRKLERLERLASAKAAPDDEDEDSLRSLVAKTDALASAAPQGCRLKKSRSVVNKNKTVISTAKDIPMNAFLAMRNSEKDERWLQNFLSESVVEDIPWECSRALILLKEGFQVRSCTLIDPRCY